MNWFSVMGLITAIALFLPIITILSLRLAWYKSFPALFAYYALVACHTVLAMDFMTVNKSLINYYGITNNFLDAPLMLSFMTYFSKTAQFRKRMKLIIPIFILFEMIMIAIYGYNIHAATIVMAPGLLLVLWYSLLFFIHQSKITIVHHKAAGKMLIVASILFAYGGYSFIYVVYYLMKTPYKTDTFLIYYLIAIFSSLLISAGIVLERRRVRQLTELQTTRKELKVIYGRSDTNVAVSRKQPHWKSLL